MTKWSICDQTTVGTRWYSHGPTWSIHWWLIQDHWLWNFENLTTNGWEIWHQVVLIPVLSLVTKWTNCDKMNQLWWNKRWSLTEWPCMVIQWPIHYECLWYFQNWTSETLNPICDETTVGHRWSSRGPTWSLHLWPIRDHRLWNFEIWPQMAKTKIVPPPPLAKGVYPILNYISYLA